MAAQPSGHTPKMTKVARYMKLVTRRMLNRQVMQVNILEAKSQLSQLIKFAQAGQEVIIANRGTPAVRLVPVAPAPPTRERAVNPGGPSELLDWLQRHPLPDYARRSAAQMDADIVEERASWD